MRFLRRQRGAWRDDLFLRCAEALETRERLWAKRRDHRRERDAEGISERKAKEIDEPRAEDPFLEWNNGVADPLFGGLWAAARHNLYSSVKL